MDRQHVLYSTDDIYVRYHYRRDSMKKHRKKIMFILKDRIYNSVYADSYGLSNSAKQVAHYLSDENYDTKLVSVVDANGIDKELYTYQPDVVIIEALWVPTYKLKELVSMPRYSKIKWIIRIHSEIGFLAAETNALKYVNEYLTIKKTNPNVHLSFNSKKINDELNQIYKSNSFIYLPNVIWSTSLSKYHITLHNHNPDVISIGCFGALRLMKNQVFQAMCAIKMANDLGKTLHFHINNQVTNLETINPILNNLRELFKDTTHQLIEHRWMNHDNFMSMIHNKIDIGMQLSFTESFNIVTADFIAAGVPILVSDAIDWACTLKASTTNYEAAVYKLKLMYWISKHPILTKIVLRLNAWSLSRYNRKAKERWSNTLHDMFHKGK